MADKSQLFSKEALDKLRSPERLDAFLPITTPVGWISLAAVGVLLLSVLLWSILGSFTVKADGMGLIMDSAGVVNIRHISSGKVSEIYITSGMKVHRGELIARLEQAEQSAETQMVQHGMGLAKNDRDAMGRVYEYDSRKKRQNVAEEVYSDYEGIVDKILVEEGDVISSGTPICTVRLTQNRDELKGVLYIPVDKGKRVEPGMSIQLAPNGVDVSKTGSLMGVVRTVSQYPVTVQTLNQELGNEQLTQYIMQAQGSALMEIRFDLVRDADSESGYLWTSIVGEHKQITAGSFVTGSIIIERQPPIEKVFYKLSQFLRSR